MIQKQLLAAAQSDMGIGVPRTSNENAEFFHQDDAGIQRRYTTVHVGAGSFGDVFGTPLTSISDQVRMSE